MKYSVHSGLEAPALSSWNTEKLKFVANERINTSLFVACSGTWESLQVEIVAPLYSSLTLMLKNNGSGDVMLQASSSAHRGASLTLVLCELNADNTQARATLDLCEEGAFAMLRSACIAASRKRLHIQRNHLQAHTEGLTENYAVVEEDGQYRMEATGKIIKGARESNSHQEARVLTTSERHSSEVVPVLLISENDVKASRVTTFRQPDENQLYYLQACGLSRRQTLSLLTVGCIMPITELLNQEGVRTALKDEIEMKVGLHA